MGRKVRDSYIEGDIPITDNMKMLRKRNEQDKVYQIIERLKWKSKIIPYIFAQDLSKCFRYTSNERLVSNGIFPTSLRGGKSIKGGEICGEVYINKLLAIKVLPFYFSVHFLATLLDPPLQINSSPSLSLKPANLQQKNCKTKTIKNV